MAGGWCSMVRLQSHTKRDNFFVLIYMHFVTLCTWTCISCLTLCVAFHYISYFHRALCSFHFFISCSESTLTVCQCCLDQKVGVSEIKVREMRIFASLLRVLTFAASKHITIHHDTSWHIMSITSAIDLEIYNCSCQSHSDPGRESDPFLKKRACVVLQGRTLGRTFSKACITNHNSIFIRTL